MGTRSRPPLRHWLVGTLGILGVFFGFVAWAMASPVAGSPDDDYHLGSIWCPNPVEGGSCEVVVDDGGEVTHVIVPETVYMSQHCWAFHSATSAACSDVLSDENLVPSYRFDTGAYPPGFYNFHHLFVGPDVHQSVVNMRVANVILGLGGLFLIASLSRQRQRHDLLVATLLAWVPMGVYFVASSNPTSWALSGCLIYAAGLWFATESGGWKRWALLVLAALGAGMAMMSRTDAAFYVFVITLALWLLIPFRRRLVPEVVVSAILSVLGFAVLLSSSQSANLTGDGSWPVDPNLSAAGVFIRNLYSLPEYVATFWGLGMGPGWLDVPLPGWATLTMLVAFGGALFAGARVMNWRKGLASLVMFGALLGIPVVSMTLRHVQPVTYYQGRYMLPLLAVTLLVWLSTRPEKPTFLGPIQALLLAAITSVSNLVALAVTTVRFTTGWNGAGSVDAQVGEWWSWGVAPKVVWMGGGISMAIGICCLLWLVGIEYTNNCAAFWRATSEQQASKSCVS